MRSLLSAIAVILLSSCVTNAPEQAEVEVADCEDVSDDESIAESKIPPHISVVSNSIVGMEEHEAIAALEDQGISWRIASRDGSDLPLTLDFNPRRINLDIEQGVVCRATPG